MYYFLKMFFSSVRIWGWCLRLMNLFVEILSFSSGRKTTKHQFDLVYIMCTECEMKQTLFFIWKKKYTEHIAATVGS